MADAVSAIPLHTLPRIRPFATLLCKKKEKNFGKTGGSERRIGVCAWGETTYGDAPRVDWSEKTAFSAFFCLTIGDRRTKPHLIWRPTGRNSRKWSPSVVTQMLVEARLTGEGGRKGGRAESQELRAESQKMRTFRKGDREAL